MNKLAKQQTLFWTLLLIAATTIIFFETGILPKGGLTTHDTSHYIIEVIVILFTIGIIPWSIKKFNTIIEKNRNTDDETYIKTYKHESGKRLGILFLVIITNIVFYYICNNENMIYCALAGGIAYIFSFPTNKAIQRVKEQ